MKLRTTWSAIVLGTLLAASSAFAESSTALPISQETLLKIARANFAFPDGFKQDASGANVWVARGAGDGAWLRIGTNKDEKIETIIVLIAPVNVTQKDSGRLFALVTSILTSVDPTWNDAASWVQDSGLKVWNSYADDLTIKSGYSPTVRVDRNGLFFEVGGVPPDFFQYVITTREKCLMSSSKDFQTDCFELNE